MDSKLSLLTLLLLPLHFPTLVFAVKAPCSACTAVTVSSASLSHALTASDTQPGGAAHAHPEHECLRHLNPGACAVQRELRTRLDAERPEARNHLDMRHRLDKDGNRSMPVCSLAACLNHITMAHYLIACESTNRLASIAFGVHTCIVFALCRYGKLIPYVDSEQRIHDLLEDLCSKVDKAVELMQACSVLPSVLCCAAALRRGSIPFAYTHSECVPQVNRTAQDGAEQLQWEWVQLAGGPKGMGQGTRKLPANEAKTSKRELGVFCESLLEKHEERIAQAIRAGAAEAGADIEDICLRIDNDVPRLQHWAQQLTSFMVRSCAGIRDVLCKRVCHGDNPIEDAQDSETDKDEL